mmetsp:Transcript_7550/g.30305  ORF Transcript_7550/g.30305 Transcript_7550/m.30305 type:complete len:383 (+) Transcript_7550:310-1458(+)
MDDERLRIPDVSQVRSELDIVDELHARIETTLDTEREHGSKVAVAEIFDGELVERVRLEAWVRHPAHLRVLFQVLRQSHSVRAVAFHAERQSLQAEDEVERSERVLAHAEIAQAFDAATHDERRVGTKNAVRAESVPKLQSMVARRRISHHWVLTVVPVHRTAVDDDAADGGAVAADPLRRAFNHDIRAVLERLTHVSASTERVVANQRNPRLLSDRLQLGKVRHRKSRIPNRLHVQRLRVRVDLRLKARRIVVLRELNVDPKSRKRHLELIVRPTVQARRRDDVIARPANRRDRQKLRALPARHRERAHAALERGDALFEHVARRVHDSAVYVPERAQPEQIGAVLGRIERVRARGVDRHRARVRRGIGRLAGVHLQGFEL